MTDVLRLLNLDFDQVRSWIDRAQSFRAATPAQDWAGRTLLLFFEKPSTRTRLSFQAAAHRLGAQSVSLDPTTSQVSRGEPLQDTAAMFGLFADAIAVRTHEHARLEQLAAGCGVPVINALTDAHHPCQILADVLTMQSVFGQVQGRKMTYVGDGNNIVQSLAEAATIFDFRLTIATPEGYEADATIIDECLAAGGDIVLSNDAKSSVKNADAVYTDTWVSMGQEEEKKARIAAFGEFQVNDELMAGANDNAIFLHCLPAYRGLEVTAEVMDGPQSRVILEAENRLYAQMAVLADIFADIQTARVNP